MGLLGVEPSRLGCSDGGGGYEGEPTVGADERQSMQRWAVSYAAARSGAESGTADDGV